MDERHLVVVGGGITGLAAAWEASADPELRVTVLDKVQKKVAFLTQARGEAETVRNRIGLAHHAAAQFELGDGRVHNIATLSTPVFGAATPESFLGLLRASLPGPDGRPAGLVGDVRATVRQLDALLADTRGSLQKLDAVLVEAQGVAANTREATTDLTALRAEVEASLRRVDGLILDLNRRWPFARDAEVKLP